MKLTDIAIRALRVPPHGQKDYWDDTLPCFGVRVSQGGSKTFVLMKNDSRRAIGRYPQISLSQARTEAKRLLAEMTLGKVQPPSMTFKELVDLFFSIQCTEQRNKPRTIYDYRRLLSRHFLSRFSERQLSDISHQHISVILDSLQSTPIEANHAFISIRAVFRFAERRRLIISNPCQGLALPSKAVGRDRTLSDKETILENGVPKEIGLRPRLRTFFDREFPTKTYTETRQQLQWRLRLLLDNPIMESMLSCKETKIDLAREMNRGMVIVIDANAEILSDIGSEFFQRFWIAMILNAARRREGQEGWQKRPCFVYCDEFQPWAHNDATVVKILDQVRAAKIGMTLAHQRRAQLSDEVFDAVINCGVKYANVENDAVYLAPKFHTTPDKMRHAPGKFTCYVRDIGAVTVSVPGYDLSEMGEMSESEAREHELRMQDYYTVPPDVFAEPQKSDPVTLQKGPEHTAPRAALDPDNIPTAPSKDW